MQIMMVSNVETIDIFVYTGMKNIFVPSTRIEPELFF